MTSDPKMTACPGNDPGCPCQDGNACHYRDIPESPAWPLPGKEKAAIALWHRFAPGSQLEWEDETHKAEYRAAVDAVMEAINGK